MQSNPWPRLWRYYELLTGQIHLSWRNSFWSWRKHRLKLLINFHPKMSNKFHISQILWNKTCYCCYCDCYCHDKSLRKGWANLVDEECTSFACAYLSEFGPPPSQSCYSLFTQLFWSLHWRRRISGVQNTELLHFSHYGWIYCFLFIVHFNWWELYLTVQPEKY